ncbi:MAG: hypothetical protein EZS28_025099 [Streblomastix strix]|uniref:Uncharacterized protein n=1 Tax=Streblomastix strix TaxID=222440 RepID=A0A5J4VAK3_9EUKA|nr:MAG: hypothetical protein EZS28_025099 [Streblomastix strix]
MLTANVGLVKTAHGGLHAYCNRDGYTLPSNPSCLKQILDSWNVDIEISFKEYIDKVNMRELGWQITEEGTIEQMNDELAQIYIDGLKNLDTHNCPQPNCMEVSLLSAFSGIYGITNEQKRVQGLGNICKFNKLTANAEKNYGKAAFS